MWLLMANSSRLLNVVESTPHKTRMPIDLQDYLGWRVVKSICGDEGPNWINLRVTTGTNKAYADLADYALSQIWSNFASYLPPHLASNPGGDPEFKLGSNWKERLPRYSPVTN